jgi:7-cyano-7-deazaguanine synthase in queuosine biosynthesis
MLADAGCWEVHSLFIDWNVRARPKANECAAGTAEAYCDTHVEFMYPVDWATLAPTIKKFTTPYANLGSLGLATQYAQFLGADYIVSGARKETTHLPDWPVRFAEAVNGNTMFTEKMYSFPVYDLTNDEVTAKAYELGVHIASTWSCSQYPACEACSSCLRRKEQGL